MKVQQTKPGLNGDHDDAIDSGKVIQKINAEKGNDSN